MSDFYSFVNSYLDNLYDELDKRYGDHTDIEIQDGVIKITFDDDRQMIINRHLPNEELWMSSPLSGGSHYRYENNQWINTKTGPTFYEQLMQDLAVICGQ